LVESDSNFALVLSWQVEKASPPVSDLQAEQQERKNSRQTELLMIKPELLKVVSVASS